MKWVSSIYNVGLWPPHFTTESQSSAEQVGSDCPESSPSVKQQTAHGNGVQRDSNIQETNARPVDKDSDGTDKTSEPPSQSPSQPRSSEEDEELDTVHPKLGPVDTNGHSASPDMPKEPSSASNATPLPTLSSSASPLPSPPPSLPPVNEQKMSHSVTATPLDVSQFDLGAPDEGSSPHTSAGEAANLGEPEIKTEGINSQERNPSPSPPPPPPSSNSLTHFPEKSEVSERDNNGGGNTATPDRGGGGNGGRVGERNHGSGDSLETSRGDSDTTSQETKGGVDGQTFADKSPVKKEDKQASRNNNSTASANVSCAGDTAAQETPAEDLNGNSSASKNEGNGFNSSGTTQSNTDIPISTPVADGSGHVTQGGRDFKDGLSTPGSDNSVGGVIGEGATGGVVTGDGGGGGGHTAGGVTEGGGGGKAASGGEKGGGLSPGPANGTGGQPIAGNGSNGGGGGVNGGGGGGQAREKSVFVRLSNRINFLEGNISLFTSYLDQISTR